MDRLIHKIRPQLLSWLHRSRSGGGVSSFARRFSYKQVKRATDGFHRIIYSDSHGTAYKARFQDGEIALVKELKDLDQGDDVFYKEVELLGRLHHRHLLALKGFSIGHKRLLVFDNIENGSLKEHLNDPLKTPLNWKTRLQIAIGVAAALVGQFELSNFMHVLRDIELLKHSNRNHLSEYLFLFSNLSMYHISISSSNIMLDENFNAKLSNFGLLSPDGNYVTMPQAPSAEAEESLDGSGGNIIFQLGVVLLELITGQSSEKGTTDLIQWIQGSRFHSSMQMMIDPDLGNTYNSKQLKNLLAVARLCITTSGDKPKFSIPQIFRYVQNCLHR